MGMSGLKTGKFMTRPLVTMGSSYPPSPLSPDDARHIENICPTQQSSVFPQRPQKETLWVLTLVGAHQLISPLWSPVNKTSLSPRSLCSGEPPMGRHPPWDFPDHTLLRNTALKGHWPSQLILIDSLASPGRVVLTSFLTLRHLCLPVIRRSFHQWHQGL